MRKSKFTEQQIIGFLKQAEAGLAVAEICHKACSPSTASQKLRMPSSPLSANLESAGLDAGDNEQHQRGPKVQTPSTHRGAACHRHHMVQFNRVYLPRSATAQSPAWVARQISAIR